MTRTMQAARKECVAHLLTTDPEHLTTPDRDISHRASWILAAVIVAMGIPALLMHVVHLDLPVVVTTFIFGVGILSAAFLLGGASEAAQHDLPASLSLAVLAFVAVLPEYAVDLLFAWRAGTDPSQAQFAVANMTGGNRLLIGVGWAAVLVAFYFMKGGRVVSLPNSISVEVGVLLLATAWSFSIPIKGSISLLDTVVLFSLFAFYLFRISRHPRAEPEPGGPSAMVSELPKNKRRLVVGAMFAYAGLVILASAEEFADGLIHTGTDLGLDEFLLVQWIAPLASESPEFLAAIYLVWRNNASAGLTALISSKVNQWTLLIGSLAVAYSISGTTWSGLPMDSRQQEEVLLTAAQSLFAVMLIVDKRLSWSAAVPLFGLFIVQFFLTGETVRLWLSGLYLVLAVALFLRHYRGVRTVLWETLTGRDASARAEPVATRR
ncbi:MAG: sodium:calcium antiporter [Dehalococcoidia bacterium]|nr:sodium:calcium antiporter [Dehalococcoidia bacterium]